MNTASLQPHFVEVGGATLEVFTGGRGPTTECFAMYGGEPGLTAEGTDLTQALQADHQIILVNARGSGHSSPPTKTPWRSLATDLERVRQYFGLRQWVLSEYANGVVSTLLFAIDHPERVAALIIGFFGSTSKVWECDNSELSLAYPATRELLSNTRLPPASASAPSQWLSIDADHWVWLVDSTPYLVWPYPISEWAMNLLEEARSMPNLLHHLDRVLAPTLVVAGTKDTIISVEECRLLADGIAGAEFLVLPNSAHSDITAEDRSQHEHVLHDFVRRHGSSKSKKGA